MTTQLSTRRRTLVLTDAVAMRQRYNPLADLTPQRATELYQAWRDGRYADVQLCWDALEEYDDMLGTLVDRRLTALEEMTGTVKIVSGVTDDDPALKALAEEQQQFLTAEYNRITDLTAAISWLGLASFRGYSMLEILDTGDAISLTPSDQWFWSRPLRRGPWLYNPNANPTHADLYIPNMGELIVRSVDRPIDIIAMFAIVVKSHGEAGWDGFIDVFGNPALFFEYPPGTDDAKAREYDEIMDAVLGDGRGGYPSGGKITPVETTARGGETFQQRCDWINRKMMYRATGGHVTVEAGSGTGTLAGEAAMEVFRTLAKAESRQIADVMNRQFSDRRLDVRYPGQPKLAYWSLDGNPSNAATIALMAGAGYRTDDGQASEITGLNVTSVDPAAYGGGQLALPGSTPIMPGILQNRTPDNMTPAENAPLNSAKPPSAPLTAEELELLQKYLSPLSAADLAAESKPLADAMIQAINPPQNDDQDNH